METTSVHWWSDRSGTSQWSSRRRGNGNAKLLEVITPISSVSVVFPTKREWKLSPLGVVVVLATRLSGLPDEEGMETRKRAIGVETLNYVSVVFPTKREWKLKRVELALQRCGLVPVVFPTKREWKQVLHDLLFCVCSGLSGLPVEEGMETQSTQQGAK